MPDMDAYTLNAQNACVKDGSVFVILTRALYGLTQYCHTALATTAELCASC